ncbi:MAG TPA: 1,2-phenylacetyl-CoA epoxidase subunit PaaE [Chitinophagaceae bacterium]|jgi:ring-1,2-phenylacetyl-CoA epoxidase subunit PaaE
MSVHFEKIRIKQLKKETPDCVSIVFDIPQELQEKFFYKHGQHLTMRTFIDGEEIRRSYSLCSSPLENEWRVAVKKAEGGLFSSYVNTVLKTGDILEVMPPLGHFYTEVDPAHKKSYVAFAAGSGITPVLSIIKTVLSTEPNSSFTLIYGNRNRTSIIFREQLEALKNKYIDRFSLIHVLSREMTDAAINHGRIDATKCTLLFQKVADINADEFFICGPEEMIFAVKDFLQKQGVEEKKIHFELFTTPGINQKIKTKTKKQEQGEKAKSQVTARLDGIMFGFEADYDGDAILDAALKQGADLPYSCKGGMCCTCKAKLLEGEVEMDVHYGLEAEEIEQGFILTCQSHPKTEKVVIDFDIK